MISTNNKYKTVICKHFEQSGQCYLGDKCHFAHGSEELRNPSDPLPPNKGLSTNDTKPTQNYQGQTLPPNVSNYKTIKCKFFEKGHCKFAGGCSFAHGDQDVRPANTPVPAHVISNMQMNNNVMAFYDQATQNQIAQQQIFFLIGQLQQYHANDQDYLAKLTQATELNNSGNVQAAASLVYGIINRKTRSQPEEIAYNGFTQQVQSLGSYLYQNLQMAYGAQTGMYGGFNPQAMMPIPMMGIPQNFGADANQPKQFGGSNYKQQQGKVQNQSNQDQSADPGQAGNADSGNMQGINTMMGNMQISNQNTKPYGGKPKNAYNKGNEPQQE